MEKYYKILYYLNQNPFENQRALARGVEMSLGQVNGLMRQLTEKGYLENQGGNIQLTERAESFLEQMTRQNQTGRLIFEKRKKKIDTTVILAAGRNPNFDCPTGLLEVGGIPLIERLLKMLTVRGIDKIYVVTGSQKEQYEEYFRGRGVTLVNNPRYKWNGTMESLSMVRDLVQDDFLLLESNLIFEETAITALLEGEEANRLVLTAPSGSKDEAYVELDSRQNLFRISKDIHQLNRIDGEMIGLSRISLSLYRKMLEYFADNQNPMLNYEYVIEDIGRIYQIRGIMVDDMAWTVIEDQELYRKARERVYPKILKRERLRKENHARETFSRCMGIPEESIEDFGISGGMTNTNFYVKAAGKEYILRIPGACTDIMINRKSERHNSALASDFGINVPTLFFDAETGVKVTQYLPDAVTLNGKTARLEMNIRKSTRLLRELHHSELRMYQDFSVRKEYEKYKELIEKAQASVYPEYQEMDQAFYRLLDRLEEIGTEHLPCHNDLVPENLILDASGRMYLIDWEYSGYNDPMWDLASHLLESEFLPLEEELYLQYYFEGDAPEHAREKIRIYEILQDILWAAWTMAKEAQGEDFGSYGRDRLKRGKQAYEKLY